VSSWLSLVRSLEVSAIDVGSASNWRVVGSCTAATASSLVRAFRSPDSMRRARVRCMIVLPAAS
jgi:hypothetical protein